MSADSLVIRYEKDVPAKDGRRTFLKGEEYAVANAAAAAKHHPDATIVGYVSGQPYAPKPPRSRSKKTSAPKPKPATKAPALEPAAVESAPAAEEATAQ